ncbi:MAG: orotate phosphoribosyltransferase [Oscillospiraceae bacterium]|jgi:orotate phosphoribosyltransferase|nr:orotate phosphoribosyltransferase [Oscillospiraceae bacterium]
MTSEEISKILLEIKSIFLRPDKPFIWASGIKSPIYCDNRLILSYPEIRSKIEAAFAELINKNFPECEVVAGTSTAGIPHAAYVSEILNLPMIYVRNTEKFHGRKNIIEGKIEPGQNVVVIEDLISTGGSSIKVAKILKKANMEVLGVVSIFNYNMKNSIQNFKTNEIKFVSLTTLDILLKVAIEQNFINDLGFRKLKIFQDNPENSKWIEIT